MKKDNIIQQKSFDFAVRIVKLYKHLTIDLKSATKLLTKVVKTLCISNLHNV